MMDETSQMGKEIRRITLALALVSCGISLMLFQGHFKDIGAGILIGVGGSLSAIRKFLQV